MLHKFAVPALASALFAPLIASAGSGPSDPTRDESLELRKQYAKQQRTIAELQRKVEMLERLLLKDLEIARGRGANVPAAPAGVQLAQQAQSLPSTAPDPAAAIAPSELASSGGPPLFERKFSLEQGITYTHYDKRSLVLSGFLALDAILLGRINLQQIKTDQLQYDLTGRWNLSDRISLDLNLPVLYRRSNYISPGAGSSAGDVSDASSSTGAVGDINAGLYYQFPKSSPTDLDWIASVRVKAPTGQHPFGIKLRTADPNNNNLVIPSRQPTGNGVWNASIGLSVLKAFDPVVLFANIGLSHNFRRGFADLSSTEGRVSPGEAKLGNALSFGAGFALALNEKTSVSFSYGQLIQQAARLRAEGGAWERQVGTDTNSATFNSSLTHQLTPRLSMVSTLAVGLTPDAPDFSVGLKFPYTF